MRLLRWPASWVLFWIGHFFSKILDTKFGDGDWWATDFVGMLYQKSMCWSFEAQGGEHARDEDGPWKKPTAEEEVC